MGEEMKEEELLVFEADLTNMREARADMIKRGEIILVLGLVLSGIVATAEALRGTGTMIFVVVLCVFSTVAFMYLIIAVLKYGRDYEDTVLKYGRDYENKLGELKKSEKE